MRLLTSRSGVRSSLGAFYSSCSPSNVRMSLSLPEGHRIAHHHGTSPPSFPKTCSKAIIAWPGSMNTPGQVRTGDLQRVRLTSYTLDHRCLISTAPSTSGMLPATPPARPTPLTWQARNFHVASTNKHTTGQDQTGDLQRVRLTSWPLDHRCPYQSKAIVKK